MAEAGLGGGAQGVGEAEGGKLANSHSSAPRTVSKSKKVRVVARWENCAKRMVCLPACDCSEKTGHRRPRGGGRGRGEEGGRGQTRGQEWK